MQSAAVPFIGPSYNLANRKADLQRTVNMYLRKVESGSGKAQMFLKSIPGLTGFLDASDGGTLPIRGMVQLLSGRAFYVKGDLLFETFSNPLLTTGVGTLVTSAGRVSIAFGREHIVIVDGANGYAFELATGTFTQISDPSFYGSTWVAYIAGRFVFGRPDVDQFYWSDIDDPLTFDALNFATAESSPDGLVWGVEYRDELWLFGAASVEVWRPSESADAAFEPNRGVSISVGCASGHTVCTIDNSLAWVGQDDDGGAVAYIAQGYQPRRVSTHAVEETLQNQSVDISSATAFAHQMDGQVFWCIRATGLETSWCYEVGTQAWHERAEFEDGEFLPYRATMHMFAFGRHLVGTDDSGIFELDRAAFVNSNAPTVLCRERTSPHYATKSMNEVFYSRFRLDCTVGTVVSSAKYVELSYSNDGGHEWKDSMPRSLGATGERNTQVQWNRLGRAKDRVYRLRCTDDVLFDIIDVDIQAEEGSS